MVKFGENNEVIQEEDGRAILVGLQLNEDITYSMQELWGLAEAAGVTVLAQDGKIIYADGYERNIRISC